MTALALLAASALRAALAGCPALVGHPPTLVVTRITECGPVRAADLPPGWMVTGCAREPAHVIEVDSRTPLRMVRSTVMHEADHACRYAQGRADWAEHRRAS